MIRGLVLAGAMLVLLGGSPAHLPRSAPVGTTGTAGATGTAGMADPAGVVYAAPLPTPIRVVRAFSPPLTRYGPGHLGVDLRARSKQIVLSAADGLVTFAGPVAGRGVVVVAHADGIRTEYEPVRPAVRRGDRVRAGQVIGRVEGTHPGCGSGCLHWGARRGEAYLDPLSLLGGLGPVRLLPWRGSLP